MGILECGIWDNIKEIFELFYIDIKEMTMGSR